MKHFASYYIDSVRSQMSVFELINKLITLDSDIRSLHSKMQRSESSDALKDRFAVLSVVTEYIKKTQERTKLVKDIFLGIENAITPLLEYMKKNIGTGDFSTNFKYISGQLDTALECIKMCGEHHANFSKDFKSMIGECIEKCHKMDGSEYQTLKDNLSEFLKNSITIPEVTVEEL